jgi:hypothetical protein
VLLLEEQMKNSSVTVVVSHLNAPKGPMAWIHTSQRPNFMGYPISALARASRMQMYLSKKEQT